MSENWLDRQLRQAMEEVQGWPKWKQEEVEAEKQREDSGKYFFQFEFGKRLGDL